MDNIAGEEYAKLQRGLEKLVGKFGIAKALKILDQLSGTTRMRTKKQQQTEVITTYVISEAYKIFGVTDPEKPDRKSKAFREARMAVYHLLIQYTELSYKEIGKIFGQGRYGVYYHMGKCNEILAIPQLNKSFVHNYEAFEEAVMQFIAKIN